MNLKTRLLVVYGLCSFLLSPLLSAGDIELSETRSLTISHSLGWVRKNLDTTGQEAWNGVLDEAKWGVPCPKQALSRNWDIRLSDGEWSALVKEKGEAPAEEVHFDLWIPADIKTVRGVVAISGHGSGTPLFKLPELRKLARELGLGLFLFNGNPVQRGFWPRSLLFEQLGEMGRQTGHPELAHAPLFLYGHSNGTGFSAIFTAGAADRVWGWVSMRPGISFQVYQPGAVGVPGLVIFGEKDPFLVRPSIAENLSIIPLIRKKHDALWCQAVEPGGGHGPGAKTWPLVLSFLRHSFTARVPADSGTGGKAPTLVSISPASGYRGENWAVEKGGYQTLEAAPVDRFSGNAATASWLINEAFAREWQSFQGSGQ